MNSADPFSPTACGTGLNPSAPARPGPVGTVVATSKAFRGIGTRSGTTVVRVSALIDRVAGVIAAR